MYMHTHHAADRTRDERVIIVAAIVWAMVAGVCVVMANAWAMGF